MPIRLTFFTVIPAPYQRELFRALAACGSFDIRVLYYSANARDRHWEGEALLPFENILLGTTLSFIGDFAHVNPSVFKALARDVADLTIVSDYSAPTAQLAMRYLGVKRRRWVFWGETPGANRRGKSAAFVRRRLQSPIGKASGIAAIGAQAALSYQGLFPHIPIFNIPYFCDLAPYEYAALMARGDRSGQAVNILFSGQLIARKGVDLLLDAFCRASRLVPKAKLLLLGDGPERGALEMKVPASLKDRVMFLGFRSPSALPAIFATADIFVLPSRYDGWGVVINEALGAGLPIIASDRVGAARELVQHGLNGLIVPADDPVALSNAIITLAATPSLRQSFAQASRKLASEWGMDAAVGRWLTLCSALIDNRSVS